MNALEQLFREEFKSTLSKLIFKNEDGSYDVFDKYRIVKEDRQYRVFTYATDEGLFSGTRSALCWCIADKHKDYNLAREIKETDTKLYHITNDISTRANGAERSKNVNFRECVGTKLESKIIRKKLLENHLEVCVTKAKYKEQRGFNHETNRVGRTQVKQNNR